MREVVELLVAELSLLSNGQWDELADLKKKKVVLASRLHGINWMPEATESEPSELAKLTSLATDLETQSRQKLQKQVDLVAQQIFALQDQHQYLRECQNVLFRKYYVPPLPSG